MHPLFLMRRDSPMTLLSSEIQTAYFLLPSSVLMY